MKGLYIERHNETVACLSKAILEGKKGGCLTAMVVDAGWHGKVTGTAEFDRIPQQVLNDVPQNVLRRMRRMRPDLLLFERTDGIGPIRLPDLQQAIARQSCKVHVIEVGYCMETAYVTKIQDKHAQHQQLNGSMAT